jgi:hypothetical protein
MGSVIDIVTESAHVCLDGLTIFNGNAQKGGGIHNRGDLTLRLCEIHSNSARYGAVEFIIKALIIIMTLVQGTLLWTAGTYTGTEQKSVAVEFVIVSSVLLPWTAGTYTGTKQTSMAVDSIMASKVLLP